MFGKFLSVANDSDKILEVSDNWSYRIVSKKVRVKILEVSDN